MRERRRKDIEMRVIRKLERAEDQKKEEEEEVRGFTRSPWNEKRAGAAY